MKKKLLIIPIIIFLLGNMPLVANDYIVHMTDSPGDDYGAGYIKYPDDEMFAEGIFDITDFKISLNDEQYRIDLTFAGKILPVIHSEFQYKYDLGNKFLLPLVHIYIDTDHRINSGFIETIAGTNVELSPESAWEKCIVIGSLPERYKNYLTGKQPEIAHRTYFPDKMVQTSDKYTISAFISENELGEITDDWGFTILVFSQDFSQTVHKIIYIREVNAAASHFNFGGGDSGIVQDFDPNVIDLIVPLGKDQKFILNSFNKDTKKYAVVPAVYPGISSVKGEALAGEVKQVTDEKVVVNLGSENGIQIGSRLMIDNNVVVIAEDVFPQLTIAVYSESEQWQDVEEGMQVRVIKE